MFRTPCKTIARDPLAVDSDLAAFASDLIDPACKGHTLSTSDHAFNPPFVDYVADSLYRLPGVEAVALGGSRAQGTHHADSDWDIAVYYRGNFDPQSIRDLGWPGHISELGAWSPVFNGGGKLIVDERAIDIHYRDLDLIDRIHDSACRGEYTVERLLFHQAGLPSYILLAELGINRSLRGSLPHWPYPEELRRRAPSIWWERADFTLQYAEEGHARHGRAAQCAGLLSEGACYAAHAILAHRREWVTNEKQLLTKAGLRWLDEIIIGLDSDPQSLSRAVIETRSRLADAVATEGIAGVHRDCDVEDSTNEAPRARPAVRKPRTLEYRHDDQVPREVARLLATVPEWFGIPDANAEYIAGAESKETWTARDETGRVVGVTLVDRHFPHVAEIHLTVVDRSHHGTGVGTGMLDAIENDARARGVRLLEVKTLGASHPDAGYARTRHFYQKFGFLPLEETDLWGDANPCLIMVKPLE